MVSNYLTWIIASVLTLRNFDIILKILYALPALGRQVEDIALGPHERQQKCDEQIFLLENFRTSPLFIKKFNYLKKEELSIITIKLDSVESIVRTVDNNFGSPRDTASNASITDAEQKTFNAIQYSSEFSEKSDIPSFLFFQTVTPVISRLSIHVRFSARYILCWALTILLP